MTHSNPNTQNALSIQPLSASMIPDIVAAFNAANWLKPAATFELYLEEQLSNTRMVWVAFQDTQVAGYITLKWHSSYLPFQTHNIPEIMDFNVLPAFRKQGIGTSLLVCAEQQAFMHADTIGLGVGLYADYGQAHQLYVKFGYKPDGLGVTYQYQTIKLGESVCLDDDLVLWFTKEKGVSNPC